MSDRHVGGMPFTRPATFTPLPRREQIAQEVLAWRRDVSGIAAFTKAMREDHFGIGNDAAVELEFWDAWARVRVILDD